MRIKYFSLVVALVFLPLAGVISADTSVLPKAQIPNCFINNGTIYESAVSPGEVKVVHGPYTSTCDRIHSIKIQMIGGGLTAIRIEKLDGGTWNLQREGTSGIQDKFGVGTFRVVIDNRGKETTIRYKGTFSVPL